MSEDNSGSTKNDSISPEASQNPQKLDEAAKRALDFYLKPKSETPNRSDSHQVFTVNKKLDTETLLANLSETLASANVMLSDLAFDLEGSRRHFALGVQQMIELSELLANRALDIVDPRQSDRSHAGAWERSETLASADAMVSDLAFDLEGSRRHVALGIQQLIELGALLANRVLDNVNTQP